jgi:Ca2+-binding RTX toxin-like protein
VGSDLLIGGAGDDLLHGDDTIAAGRNTEWAVTVNRPALVDPNAADQPKTDYTWTIQYGGTIGTDTDGGDDTLYGGKGNDWLLGGAGNDLLDGGTEDDVLFGEAGHDTLLGGAGQDMLAGGANDDWLDGGTEVDHLFGGAGDDVLIGGAGDDFLWGGTGRDTYIYNKGDGEDRVYDDDALKDASVFIFGQGIAAKDVILRKGSLLLDFGDGDALHIENFNPDDPLADPSVASFEFCRWRHLHLGATARPRL